VIKRPKHIKTVLSSYIFIALSVVTASQAWAQSDIISEAGANSALELSQLIKTEKLLTENMTSLDALALDTLSSEDKLRHIRQHAHGTLALSNNFDPENVLAHYKAAIELSGNERDKAVFKLHQSFLKQVDLSRSYENTEILLSQLEQATEDTDWFVANNAWLLMSVLNSFTNNPNLALQQAQEAYKKIPTEISPYVTDARILTLGRTTYLNNLLLNPELAIENTAELIAQKQAAGYPIDGSSLLNNLLYSLTMWREYEVSTQIANTVLELEKKVGSNTPGLTELRVAQLHDRQGEFGQALFHVRKGLEIVEIPTLKNSLLFLEVNSLSGLGRIYEAERNLAKLNALPSPEKANNMLQARLARAEFGLAVNKGNKENIYKLSNKLLDYKTQNLLRSYSTNTSKLVASLENTKERQAEREDALKREAEQQINSSGFLLYSCPLRRFWLLYSPVTAIISPKNSRLRRLRPRMRTG